MNKLIHLMSLFLTLLAVSYLINLTNTASAAGLSVEDKIKLAKCEFPTEVKNKIKSMNETEFKQYLENEDPDLTLKYSVTTKKRMGGMSYGTETYYTINRDVWVSNCTIVYGTPQDVPIDLPFDQQWKPAGCYSCAAKKTKVADNYVPQYLGFSEFGYPVPNKKYPEFVNNAKGTNYNFVQNRPIVNITAAGICQRSQAYYSLKHDAENGSRNAIIPSCSGLRFDDNERVKIMDGFYLNAIGFPYIDSAPPKGFNGYFDEVNFKKNERILTMSADVLSDNINKYADLNVKSGNWSYGVFTMWSRFGVSNSRIDSQNEYGSDDWWYHVYTIFPNKCPSDVCGIQNNAYVKALGPNPTTATVNKPVDVKFRVRNDFKQKSISAPCLATETQTMAGCQGDGYNDAYIKLTNIDTGKVVQPFTAFTYDIAKASFKDFNIPVTFPEPGRWKVTIVIPHYKTENVFTDNTDSFSVNVKSEDAFIADKSKKVFTKDENIELKLNITNNMSDKIGSSGQTTEKISNQTTHSTFYISIKNNDTGEEVYKEEKNFSTNPEKTDQIVVTPSLPSGRYIATASIPYYEDENATIKWNNNSVTFNFDVERSCLPKPQPPENLECKGYNIPYTQNRTSGFPKGPTKTNENENKIIKMCIGMYPNHPSTNTEGGQGAYFVVNYRFFPMPLPPYEVRTINQMDGGKGYCQVYNNTEVNNRLGEDDAGEIDSFIYYPTQDGIGANNYKNLAKPYIVGPHSFKHYKYRGRMLAREVDFTFEIIGPDGKTKEAEGSIKYEIPDKCYVKKEVAEDGTIIEGIIDFKQVQDYDNPTEMAEYGHCREIYFYLPIKDKENFTSSQADLDIMHEIPTSKERIHFNNPGIYTFNFEAKEQQEYRYQEDLGKEYQGRVANSGLINKGLPREGITNPSIVGTYYEKQVLSEITIDKEIGDGPKNTTKDNGGTPDETYQNRCYLEQDGFDRTAFDAKDQDASGDPKGFGLPAELNAKMHSDNKHICFHDHSIDYHYWLYDWSEPKWYTD